MIFILIGVYLILGLAVLKIMNNLLLWCGYDPDNVFIVRPLTHDGMHRDYLSFTFFWFLWPTWFPIQIFACLMSLPFGKPKRHIRDFFDRVFEFFDKIVR